MLRLRIARRWLVAASPAVLIAVGHVAERVSGRFLGAWAWAPTILVFWAVIAGLIAWGGGERPWKRWLAPPSGSWFWSILAVAMGLLSLREILAGWRTLESPLVLACWLVFGLVNPWLEEGYWRGLLVEATQGWPFGLGIVYSSAAFALSHPLVWGVHSAALAKPAALVGLVLVGLVWSVAYARTGSLRFTIAGHMCANLLGLAVPVMLNLHVPAGLE